MKIRKLYLKNIGVFDDETIEFKPCPAKDKAEVHIFTGHNGSGKSTILMALANSFSEFSKEAPNTSFYKRFRYEEAQPKHIHGQAEVKVWFDDKASVGFSESLTKYKDGVLFHFQSPTLSKKLKHYLSYFVKSSESVKSLSFAPFAFSGYRQLKSERIEAIYEPKDFNPLSQSLEFVKDYSQSNQVTVNQLVANNFSKKWIESNRSPEKSAKFARVISTIEQAIFEITNWKIEFDLETEPINLVLKLNGEELDFDVLPDGLRSLISWMADLLGRVDLLKWADDLPINEKNLILFLDEIEVHLHPAWQRKVLPVVQKLFRNSQIFISTHSPFVVNSVDDAWVYKLKLEDGKACIAEIVGSEDSKSYIQVLREIFDVEEKFGKEVQDKLDKFEHLRDKILETNVNGAQEKELLKLAKLLANEPSDELKQIVRGELRQLSDVTGEDFSL